MKNQIVHVINEAREDREKDPRCLEGDWQHGLAVFKQHGNINHRDKMEVARGQTQPVSVFIMGVLGILCKYYIVPVSPRGPVKCMVRCHLKEMVD